MKKHLNVLVVEDSEDDVVLLLREIQKGGYDPTFVRVETAGDMLTCLNDQTWDIVISDFSLPKFSALEALKVLQETGLDLPFIVVSGKVEVAVAVEALNAGAHDFIKKSSMIRLCPAIERELNEVIVRKERKKADEALKESEEEIRTLYSAMNEGVAMHEIIYGEAGEPVDYRILNINPAFELITGIKREDAIGATGSKLYGTDEAPYLDIYAKVAASGEPITFESTFEPMGKSFKISVFSSEKGKFATLFADITKRKKNEEKLKLNDMRMKALVDLSQMTDSSFSDTADFVRDKIVALTKSEYGFIGLMNEDESAFTIHSWAKDIMDICAVNGKPIEFPIEPDSIWGDVVQERKTIIVNDYSDLHTHKAGLAEGHVPVSSVIVIPTFEEDKIVAIAAVANKKTNYDDSDVHQITLLMDGMWKLVQRKRSDEKLKQAATEWAITFDSITDPVSIQDRDFKLVRVNKAYANAMNAKPDDLIGKFCYNVVHGTDECIPNCPHKQSLETKQPSIIEVFESRLGKYIEMSTSPIFDENYEVSGSVHTIKDITERKAAEEEKRNFLVERTRTQLQNFVVSALPVFASGTTPQTRNILVSKFSQNFENNVLPEFKQEMDDLNEGVAVQGTESTAQTENLSRYLLWLLHFFTNLGAQPKTTPDGLSGNIEFSNCHWQDDGDFNPIFCLICRAMVLRSFSWTNLKGSVTHSDTIASGSSTCRFDIVLLPDTDVIDSSE